MSTETKSHIHDNVIKSMRVESSGKKGRKMWSVLMNQPNGGINVDDVDVSQTTSEASENDVDRVIVDVRGDILGPSVQKRLKRKIPYYYVGGDNRGVEALLQNLAPNVLLTNYINTTGETEADQNSRLAFLIYERKSLLQMAPTRL